MELTACRPDAADQGEVRERWARNVGSFLPGWIDSVPALKVVASDLDVVFHGSTCAGIDDEWSDLDLWGFVSEESLARADALSPTRFYEFKLNGKPGHLNLETRAEAMARLVNCQLERIAELRQAIVLQSCGGWVQEMLAHARSPMPKQVRQAMAMYHYVEMRSEHRACDTPIERGDSLALLLAMTPCISHALRCAMVIDGEPYPYSKWLGHDARRTPTGSGVYRLCQEMLEIIGQGDLRRPGPEKGHPVSLKIREIRAALVEAARKAGIDEPWLTHWWLYMTQARDAIAGLRWC